MTRFNTNESGCEIFSLCWDGQIILRLEYNLLILKELRLLFLKNLINT